MYGVAIYQIEHYSNEFGKDFFQDYLDSMKDKLAHLRILRRIDKARMGNFGDHKRLSEHIYELRVDVGEGHRVYYAHVDNIIVLLLCAGAKKTQKEDIINTEAYFVEYTMRRRYCHE